ncbi:MAG: MBOAT family protein [Sphingobacteriales bacterium]|nr:MAG: MBOAT family protein [Sphingobacteriales bacterium]
MIFNSISFIIFFILTTIVYFLLPHRFRWLFLLAISCYFYMAFKPIYILILAFTIIVDYFAGILMEDKPKQARLYLWLSIIANVGVLAIFKYYNFINENLTMLLGRFAVKNEIPYLHIILPLGLSFHTFQAMSYTIEVYRGNQKAERHFGIYSLYVMYYPQMVAGPIERPQNMLHQFYEKVDFDYERIVAGLKQMLWGMFKKVVIADRLTLYVDAVFNNPEHHSGISCLVAGIFFTFQMYCDFSGYTDIALGASKVLGINLMTNFNFPLFSRSMTEYWRRWHISLSTWFSDYLFTPVITTLRNWGKTAIVFGLMLTFFTSGVWHGAGWTYIIWGLMHGLALSYEFLTKKSRKKLFNKLPQKVNEWLSVALTFSYVTLSLIIFRAATVHDACTIVGNIFGLKKGGLFIGFAAGFVYSITLILFLLASEINEKVYNNKYSVLYSNNAWVRRAGYVMLVLMMLMIGVFNGGQFIYFQF